MRTRRLSRKKSQSLNIRFLPVAIPSQSTRPPFPFLSPSSPQPWLCRTSSFPCTNSSGLATVWSPVGTTAYCHFSSASVPSTTTRCQSSSASAPLSESVLSGSTTRCPSSSASAPSPTTCSHSSSFSAPWPGSARVGTMTLCQWGVTIFTNLWKLVSTVTPAAYNVSDVIPSPRSYPNQSVTDSFGLSIYISHFWQFLALSTYPTCWGCLMGGYFYVLWGTSRQL